MYHSRALENVPPRWIQPGYAQSASHCRCREQVEHGRRERDFKLNKLHEEALGYFAGAPQTIRLDNLKEGVIKPDVYDAQLNTLYAKPLEHYGVVPLPCRPYASDLKGKVESAVGHRQGTGLKGRPVREP